MNGCTAEELAQLLDIHVDRVVEALESLEAKGLVKKSEHQSSVVYGESND